ncbi:MAG TPA: ergothioneine biosynthesis protein EgtB [Gammaproteobacteria bacterium]|nr:iron(II)-dependent oxidoreductase EgtB [bacterium BMS3Abin11]HDH16060.1 ergothioneine biosynthesis protein EgtB [Gammaproteobacteria bacterium]HDZ78438.1 ergothioneine biosynthesis protein EgtB [Gammaproteobacteria bacterium]
MVRLSIDRLSSLHDRLIKQFSSCSVDELRIQYHPDLSPLGWHLAHIAFIEQYWLREAVLGDNSRTADLHQYYFPEMIDKSERGKLPGITDFSKLKNNFSDAENLSFDLLSSQQKHPLLENDYIAWFLLQHGQQHLETMQMALYQKALKTESATNLMTKKFNALEPVSPAASFAEGIYEVGSSDVLACDNEQPVHEVRLSTFQIAEKPVSNAEYLGFMQAAGYQYESFWNRAGWQWITDSKIRAPEYWLDDVSGNWCALSKEGFSDIDPDAAVSGLSWYEADAFARYAGYRLPHEHEWEAAMKADPALMHTTGKVWEWCANTFFPYEGFRAFPYERYSSPWFDDDHYMLKGRSPYSGESVSQPSFRNFYQPEKRHVFAGLRLARDA